MNLNKKFLNWAAWIILLLAYVLPYQSTDGFATRFGYPIPFLITYNTKISGSLLSSAQLKVLAFIIDILIVYFVINLADRQLKKVKSNKDNNSIKDYK